MSFLADLKMVNRFALDLRGFLQRPIKHNQAAALVCTGIENRERNFLRLIERGVFGYPKSPYLPLLKHAGCTFGDLAAMVRASGLEKTLSALHQAQVYVTFEEFKGRRPIVRAGHSYAVQPSDFYNPWLTRHYQAQSGGTTGVSTRLFVDLDLLALEAPSHLLFLTAFDLLNRPLALWRPVPPGVSGLMNVLRHAKIGGRVARWFSQSVISWRENGWANNLQTYLAVHAGRMCGRQLPAPRHVPLAEAHRIAHWLAAQKRKGLAAQLDTNASSGLRVCLAARERGLDIADTFFRLGGEPYTQAKAMVVAASGCRAASHYSMAEAGRIGVACSAAAQRDDVHLLLDKLAVTTHETKVRGTDFTVPVLTLTTLHPACSFIMLNVVSDDYGVIQERNCGCPLGEAGLRQHLHSIRSHEKLNSEGMTFFGIDLVPLVEKVLPARFGGDPTDFQLVESEEGGLPRVHILIHPRVGPIVEAEAIAAVLAALRTCPDGVMMTERWQAGQTLRVDRRPPYATPAAKILPLHILREI